MSVTEVELKDGSKRYVTKYIVKIDGEVLPAYWMPFLNVRSKKELKPYEKIVNSSTTIIWGSGYYNKPHGNNIELPSGAPTKETAKEMLDKVMQYCKDNNTLDYETIYKQSLEIIFDIMSQPNDFEIVS